MNILNTRVYLEIPPKNEMYYTPAPKVYVTYTIDADTLFRTYCTIKLYTTSNTYETYTSEYSFIKDSTFSVEIPPDVAIGADLYADVTIYVQESTFKVPSTVAQLTEQVSYPKYSPVTEINPNEFVGGFLKAFCSFSELSDLKVYCTWEKSTDGLNYTPISLSELSPIYYKALKSVTYFSENLSKPSEDIEDTEDFHIAKVAYALNANSENDLLKTRPDILQLTGDITPGTVYSFKMFTLKDLDTAEDMSFNGSIVQCLYEEDLVLGYVEYVYLTSYVSNILYTELPNCASGKLHYSGTVAYSYGIPSMQNNILASYAGETVTPISRVIPLPAQGTSTVTALIPWRNYLIAATPSEMFIISKVDGGFTSKVISTFIGIPTEDAKCVKATANGIIFKAYNKIYMFYPNMYSSDESILNLTELSSPIEDLVKTYSDTDESLPFAISTDTAYYLMMPQASKTTCLKYTYLSKVWTYYEYPVQFIDYNMINVNDIRIYGRTVQGLVEYCITDDASENEVYGDQVYDGVTKPVHFVIDSGQKSDKLNSTNQFVESKFNLATLHSKDCFPMTVTVYIDGSPHIITNDVNTDAAFWKSDVSDIGVLNTDYTSEASDIFNVFRQMFLRYSGKGRSIRHIIEGDSVCPFKIYEIDYRYKKLNTKQ